MLYRILNIRNSLIGDTVPDVKIKQIKSWDFPINTRANNTCFSSNHTHLNLYSNMRTTSLLLTLAYAATLVMGRPTTTTTDAAKATETSSSGQVEVFTHCNRPGVFALTFDDGPDKYSWGLAQTLKDQGIKATFFLNGDNSVYVYMLI